MVCLLFPDTQVFARSELRPVSCFFWGSLGADPHSNDWTRTVPKGKVAQNLVSLFDWKQDNYLQLSTQLKIKKKLFDILPAHYIGAVAPPVTEPVVGACTHCRGCHMAQELLPGPFTEPTHGAFRKAPKGVILLWCILLGC